MSIFIKIFVLSIFVVVTIANENELKIDYLVSLKECNRRTKSGDHISM